MEEFTTFEQNEFSLCVRVRERLPDLLDGFLDALTAEAIRAHLATCYQCSRDLRELRQTIRLVESLPFVEPLRDHAPAIMAAVERQSGHSFQAPVVEMETQRTLRSPYLPRTTNGLERHFLSAALGLQGAIAAVA
ncbi:MAG TPA: zf-HC2 domain-containing protein [Chthonomonadales bacterium]|nr:zf-HC2 domain-containing protein [Chthonomonadales bacterium]